MRAANQMSSESSPSTAEFGFAPVPDQDAVAGFDALLASVDPETARQLLRECLDGIALWQHHLRVQESHYAGDEARPREMFRIR